jgi:hypothetical protein
MSANEIARALVSMMARSTKRSNQRPNTLMQDRLPPNRRRPLATHGRTIHRVKSRSRIMILSCPVLPQERTNERTAQSVEKCRFCCRSRRIRLRGAGLGFLKRFLIMLLWGAGSLTNCTDITCRLRQTPISYRWWRPCDQLCKSAQVLGNGREGKLKPSTARPA